ncbi:MAG: esterase family protein [Candidatus Sumerlaeia bacterium]|nr:esterase family protein [Candidatus Sumerlaeia bacterium]
MPYPRVEKSFPRFTPEGFHFLTFLSPALGARDNVTLWIPPGHEEAGNLPMVVLLHGVFGSNWSWAFNGGAHVAARDLIASGAIRPMALVMPSDGLLGEGSGYLKTPTRDCERWIVDDVIGCARDEFACFGPSLPVFLAGFSMGGFGALRLGAKYPDRFRAIAGHSSVTHFDQMALFVANRPELYGEPPEEDRSVLYWMRHHRAALPPVRFDCGVEDKLFEHNRALHDALLADGIPHTFAALPGTHSWAYWHEHLADTLAFFDEQLR